MPPDRQDRDRIAFAAALAAPVVLALGFVSIRYGAAAVMCAFCVAGILGGRLAGLRGTVLLAVAVGLCAILWIAWLHPPGGALRTSFMAHVGAGALVGAAVAEALRHRIAWPAWGLAALLTVAALTLAWEAAEYLGDRVLDTALVPNKRDSALDIVFGVVAGSGAIALVRLFHPRRSPA